MNLTVITTRKEIDAAQRSLADVIRGAATEPQQRKLGYQGGADLADVWYVERVGMWFASTKAENRWWNAFGLGDPTGSGILSIVAEVNPAFDGSRRSAGAFLRDADGRVWVAHDGRVGEGKKGVGKRAFLDAFSGSVKKVDGQDFIIIGRIDDDDFVDELGSFVRTVQKFKAGIDGDRPVDGHEKDELDESDDQEPWKLKEVLGGLEGSTARTLLEWFAEALRRAHLHSAACWAVTRRDGPRVRLLVGHTVAFEIRRDRIGVGLHLPSVPDGLNAEADGGQADFAVTRLDGCVVRWFSLDTFLRAREALRTSALQFIDLAAGAYRNSPYARHHAPELLDEISEAVGTALPRPVYRTDVGSSYWKIAPGEKARLWDQCRQGKYIAIGWDELGDLSGLDRDGFEARREETMRAHPEYDWKRKSVDQVWRFINIPPGSKIVANDGTRRVVGIGTVTGPYRYVDDGKEFAHRLPVRWDDLRERVVEQPGWVKTVIQLSPASFASIVAAPSPGEIVPAGPPPEAEPPQTLDFVGIMDRLEAAKLQFPEELVASYLLALQTKRFVILAGISGTGKTQLALEVAKAFQPLGAALESGAKAPKATEGHLIRVQPYMLKFRRLVVPAVLAESVKGDAAAGRVQVKFGDGQSELLKWSAQSTATQLLFKGAFREWFAETFKPGDQLDLRVEEDDPPVLSIAPVGATESRETAGSRPATYSVIAVRPDWTDNRGLLGYYNPITREYQATPFLRLLLAARDEWDTAAAASRAPLPYFVVLDEMNLARVEHYFSDFLSCLESGEPLHLHDDPLVADGGSESGAAVPLQVGVPRNLFFTGTVNVDETTYMFSPKVLDRAFVLEFNDVDLEGLATPAGDDEGEETSALRLTHFEGALDIREKASREDYWQMSNLAGRAVHRALSSLNARLAVEHRHFGYRVANEIARFIGLAVAQAGKDPEVIWEALDVAVLAKVLPKIHGTQQEVEDVLTRLLAFAVNVESDVASRESEAAWEFATGRITAKAADGRSPRLPRTAAKLWRMLRRVRLQGYVSFIE